MTSSPRCWGIPHHPPPDSLGVHLRFDSRIYDSRGLASLWHQRHHRAELRGYPIVVQNDNDLMRVRYSEALNDIAHSHLFMYGASSSLEVGHTIRTTQIGTVHRRPVWED